MNPLDPVLKFLEPWSNGLLAVGVIFLGGCGTFIGMKIGVRSAAAKRGESGHRESLGAVFGLALAGLVMGGAAIVVALAVKLGQGAGTV